MKDVCGAFVLPSKEGSQRKKNEKLARVVSQVQVPPELSEVARIFVQLQEERHKADYDLGYRPRKSGASELIARARDAHQHVQDLGSRRQAHFELFLTLLLSGDAKVRDR